MNAAKEVAGWMFCSVVRLISPSSVVRLFCSVIRLFCPKTCGPGSLLRSALGR